MSGAIDNVPSYPLVDAPEDGGIEVNAYVPAGKANTPAGAVHWFTEQFPEALEGHDGEMELVATGRKVWMREGPCLSCEGSGAEPRPRLDWLGPVLSGPQPACESCEGTGEQGDCQDYIVWKNCAPGDAGAVEFWELELVDTADAEASA